MKSSSKLFFSKSDSESISSSTRHFSPLRTASIEAVGVALRTRNLSTCGQQSAQATPFTKGTALTYKLGIDRNGYTSRNPHWLRRLVSKAKRSTVHYE